VGRAIFIKYRYISSSTKKKFQRKVGAWAHKPSFLGPSLVAIKLSMTLNATFSIIIFVLLNQIFFFHDIKYNFIFTIIITQQFIDNLASLRFFCLISFTQFSSSIVIYTWLIKIDIEKEGNYWNEGYKITRPLQLYHEKVRFLLTQPIFI
jgi:hypothetical protein